MAKATYDLKSLQAIVAAQGIGAFNVSALNGIAALGMTVAQALAVIAGLQTGDLYKTMATVFDPGMFQDVYRKPMPNGKVGYIKLTACANGRVVVQFKEK